jgi:hypothetical protein
LTSSAFLYNREQAQHSKALTAKVGAFFMR